MFGHDIIVIGASVGGVEAIPRLINTLPADLPASVFVVLHTTPHGPGLLPLIISKTSALPVRHAVDGEKKWKKNSVCPPVLYVLSAMAPRRMPWSVSSGPRRGLSMSGPSCIGSESESTTPRPLGKNAGARARELEAQSALIRKLLKTYQPD